MYWPLIKKLTQLRLPIGIQRAHTNAFRGLQWDVEEVRLSIGGGRCAKPATGHIGADEVKAAPSFTVSNNLRRVLSIDVEDPGITTCARGCNSQRRVQAHLRRSKNFAGL